MKHSHPDYLYNALLLDVEQQELILSRMRGKLPKRFFKGKITLPEAVALQMEIEDQQLHAWRQKRTSEAQACVDRPVAADKAAKAKKSSGKSKVDPKRVTLESIAPPDWTDESTAKSAQPPVF